MSTDGIYRLLADAVLFLHVLLVLFVIGGLVLIVIGNLKHRRWEWVNTLVFRLAHLGTIAIVVAESWLNIVCPLTDLEMWLRGKAHQATYGESFIEHWLQQILYYDAPPWVFAVLYTLFAALVAATWIRFPPVRSRRAGR